MTGNKLPRGYEQRDSGLKKKKKTKLYCGVCACIGVCVQPCLTLCGPMECIPPGSSFHGIFQAGLLKWVTISSTMQYLDRID